MTEKINIVTVNFYSADFIFNLIELFNNENIHYNFIIADNSGELDHADVSSHLKNNSLVIVKNNFASSDPCESHVSGLNCALSRISFSCPCTLFIDPDICFTKGSLIRCIEKMKRDNIDIIGTHKFYQWHKKRPDINLPYIYFTLIKTEYLKKFKFKYIKNNGIKRIYNFLLGKKIKLDDSGDSIYSLTIKKGLNSYIINKFLKTSQTEKYPFINIQTDDWLDTDSKIAVSHFRGGSDKRIKLVHKRDEASKKVTFLKESKRFLYNDNHSLSLSQNSFTSCTNQTSW